MAKLKQLIQEISNTLAELEECTKQLNNPDKLESNLELARRYFIRKFASLSENLIYFRKADPQRMKDEEIETLKQQFLITEPIAQAKNSENSNLVGGFTTLRNQLLHKYPYEHILENNEQIYIKALAYFKSNKEILENAIEKIKKEQNLFDTTIKEEREEKSFGLTKISYLYEEKKANVIDFEAVYIRSLQAVFKEIKSVIGILEERKLKILGLIEDPCRKSKEITDIAAFQDRTNEIAEILYKYFSQEKYLKSALDNCFENISVFLKDWNKAYIDFTELREAEGLTEQQASLLNKHDEIYEKVEKNEPNSIAFLNQAAFKRISIAHNYESSDLTQQLISDLISLFILQNNFISPALGAIQIYQSSQEKDIEKKRRTVEEKQKREEKTEESSSEEENLKQKTRRLEKTSEMRFFASSKKEEAFPEISDTKAESSQKSP